MLNENKKPETNRLTPSGFGYENTILFGISLCDSIDYFGQF